MDTRVESVSGKGRGKTQSVSGKRRRINAVSQWEEKRRQQQEQVWGALLALPFATRSFDHHVAAVFIKTTSFTETAINHAVIKGSIQLILFNRGAHSPALGLDTKAYSIASIGTQKK